MATYYDVARMATTMAMTTTVVLDPTKITVRVKNSIKRQLRQGCISGGYRSQAAKIATVITQKLNLPVTQVWWRGVILNNPNEETRNHIRSLVEADWALTLLETPQYGNVPYYRNRYELAMRALRNPLNELQITFHDRAYADQARDYLAQCLNAEQREQIEKAIDMIDGTEPIHVFTYQ